MPVTPFHMGPGFLIKALLPGCFSLIIFGWAQILMDIQPLLAIITGKGHLHGFSHTYIGATLIAVFTIYTGKWVYEWISKWLLNDFTEFQKSLFIISKKLTFRVSVISAFTGTYSHVILDSIMHGDVEPFYPYKIHNHMHLFISIESLYKFCVYTGMTGVSIYLLVRIYKVRRNSS